MKYSIGARGADVLRIQNALFKIGYKIVIDGVFGKKTASAVKDFQKVLKLKVDGIVGPVTWKALGLDDEIPEDGPKRPRSYPEVYKIFGDPTGKGFRKKNIAFCAVHGDLKAFSISKVNGNTRGFYCHTLLVPVFQNVFDDIVAQGLTKLIKTFDGCWNVRNISGSTTMSLHSWAIAIDINYAGNELGDDTPSMDKRIVAIFKKHGFFWGGDYKNRKDGMHFEYFDRS